MEEIEKEFWKKKTLYEMNTTEWEALCDCCGRCCYVRFFDVKKHLLCSTRVACDWIDLKTGKCTCYENRFSINKKCNPLMKSDIPKLHYFLLTCAYRIVFENKELQDWHPLITGNYDKVPHIENSIHESAAKDFHDYVFESVPY